MCRLEIWQPFALASTPCNSVGYKAALVHRFLVSSSVSLKYPIQRQEKGIGLGRRRNAIAITRCVCCGVVMGGDVRVSLVLPIFYILLRYFSAILRQFNGMLRFYGVLRIFTIVKGVCPWPFVGPLHWTPSSYPLARALGRTPLSDPFIGPHCRTPLSDPFIGPLRRNPSSDPFVGPPFPLSRKVQRMSQASFFLAL